MRSESTPRRVVLAAVVLASIGLVACGDDDEVSTRSTDRDSTSTTAEATTTTGKAEPSSTTTEGTTTVTSDGGDRPTPVEEAPAFDGPCARHDASEPDRLAVEVCQVGRSATEVTIRVVATDGDADVRDDCGSPLVEWSEGPTAVCQIGCVSEGTGPDSIDRRFTHEYGAAGTHHVVVTVESSCGQAPTGEQVTVELDVTTE